MNYEDMIAVLEWEDKCDKENEAYQKVGIYLREKLHSLRKENRLNEAKELGNAYDIINKYTNNSLDLKEKNNKTGHWIDVGNSWCAMYECSECGYIADSLMSYCPHCGKEIKGEKQ